MDADPPEFLRRLRAGEVRAFEELVIAHQHRVFGVALRMLGGAAEGAGSTALSSGVSLTTEATRTPTITIAAACGGSFAPSGRKTRSRTGRS